MGPSPVRTRSSRGSNRHVDQADTCAGSTRCRGVVGAAALTVTFLALRDATEGSPSRADLCQQSFNP